MRTDGPAHVPTDVAALATGFSRALRAAGLDAPPSATVDFAQALTLLGTTQPQGVFWAGEACFVRGPEDIEPYAVVFVSYFGHAAPIIAGGRLTTVPPSIAPPRPRAVDADPSAGDAGEPPGSQPPVAAAWSPREILRAKDFADCSEAELAEASRLMAHLRRQVPMRRGRRLVPAGRGHQGVPDVRRTLREALRTGGDPGRLARRVASERPRRVVFLLDVSGSMRPYARALLRFAHTTVVAQRRVEAFTLGTRCTRVSRELSWRDPDAALRRATQAAPDIDGGTRLGEAVRAFNEGWGIGGLARGAIVVLCSDGWDRGDPKVLGSEMQRLSRVTHRLVWVNPLKASDSYEPLARGMAAALPYVDEFVSGHSLGAVEELADLISR
ncbi:MAG: vWA domain-containing protein [Acidimicrobiales bacterium]